jgi:hypothetical protein
MKTLKTFDVSFDDWYSANYDQPKPGKKKMFKVDKSLAADYRRSLATAEFTKLINYLMYVGAIK